jgi:hypothetical protein
MPEKITRNEGEVVLETYSPLEVRSVTSGVGRVW